MGQLYPLSKNPDIADFQLLVSEDPIDVLPAAAIPELVITTTTTTAAPTTTTTTLAPLQQPQCPAAIAVNGYYPLYETEACANQHSGGNGTAHTHVFNSITYYMPNGLTMGVDMFHGDYPGTTTTTTSTTSTTTAAPTTTTTTQYSSPSPGPSYY